jgi:predicted acyltransferase
VTSPAPKFEPLVPAIEPGPPPAATSNRIVSLDVFRGLTIAAMILVNNPGSWNDVYGPLTHAQWNGWTAADLVFPFFLFIVGVAITLSLGSETRNHARIGRRTLLLFALGLGLNALGGFESFATLRIPGVLQRIALCYLAASLLFLHTGPRGQALSLCCLLVGYWALLDLVPVGGRSPGWLDPERNVTALVDRRLLGAGHLYHETWDPEGLLSTIPAIATTLFGVLTGHWLRSARTARVKTLGLAAAGAAVIAAGLVFDRWMPINKNLWTSSYVVFTGGMALLLFALCYGLVDAQNIRRPFVPLIVFGVNPIAVYVLSTAGGALMEVTTIHGTNLRDRIYHVLFTGWSSPPAASLLFALGYVLLWLAAMSVLYRRKIFVRI